LFFASFVLVYSFHFQAETTAAFPRLPHTDKFLIGVMESYNDLDNYKLGGFNTTHKYIYGRWDSVLQRHTPRTKITGIEEDLFDPVPSNELRKIISDVYNNHNASRFIWQRPKIEWLCLGQSSIYEAEPISLNDDYWFYSFASVSGTPRQDHIWNNGKTVLHCSNIGSGPRGDTVLKRLKANTEQSRRSPVGGINQWGEDSESNWFVKPKIRIPPSFISGNEEVDICRISVKMHDGITDKIEPVNIKAKHFLDENLEYDGRYLEEFYFDGSDNPPRAITFKGDLVLNATAPFWFNSARGNYSPDPENINRADIQVYWYDNCEMWIDYIKVENDVAHDLLSNDPLNLNWVRYNKWIEDEANAINQEPYVYNFYTELFEFNNIPCMAYVNKKIDSITGGRVNFMTDQLPFFFCHMPWEEKSSILTPEKVKTLFFNVTNFKQIYVGNPYPITANFPAGCYDFLNPQISVVPSSLPVSSGDTILAVSRSPENYDRWLQSRFDTACTFYEGGNIDFKPNKPYPYEGVFMFMLKWAGSIAKLCDIPLIVMLQAHQFVNSFEVDREPTIEEQDVMTNLAVSYGAKGIMYWWMPSYFNNMCDYSFGLIRYGVPRERNLYGQPKWDSFKQTLQRLEKWGPTLMTFSNKHTDSYIYRLEDERERLHQDSFFKDIVSYKNGTGNPACTNYFPDTTNAPHPSGLKYECFEDRFLQVATFKIDLNDIDKYFMIVNRRCSPVQEDYNDGRRYIRIIFDPQHPDFSGFTYWNVVDIESGTIIKTVDMSSSNPFADLKWFNPGEGKLIRLMPESN